MSSPFYRNRCEGLGVSANAGGKFDLDAFLKFLSTSNKSSQDKIEKLNLSLRKTSKGSSIVPELNDFFSAMQKLITVSREDLDMLEASWKPCLPILSNEIAEKTNKTFEKMRGLLGMGETKLRSKRSAFTENLSSKDEQAGKPSPPPLRSKPAPVATPKNDSKPVTEEPPADKHPVPKETVAEKQPVTIDVDASDCEKEGKPSASKTDEGQSCPVKAQKPAKEVEKVQSTPSKKRVASTKDASPKPRKRLARASKKKNPKVHDSSSEYDD